MPATPKVLEIIVSSLEDAIEAEAGGADRLEVVRDLASGGLTPDLDLVRQILNMVKVPVRVMLRENASMALADRSELETLCRNAAEFSKLGVDGLVAGFISNDELDLATLQAIATAAPQTNITFHRAFDSLANAESAIKQLKNVRQVDRILTPGEPGEWPERQRRLHRWQQIAAPEITILAAAGLTEEVIAGLLKDPEISEIHIGRAARSPAETYGLVSRAKVERIKGLAG